MVSVAISRIILNRCICNLLAIWLALCIRLDRATSTRAISDRALRRCDLGVYASLRCQFLRDSLAEGRRLGKTIFIYLTHHLDEGCNDWSVLQAWCPFSSHALGISWPSGPRDSNGRGLSLATFSLQIRGEFCLLCWGLAASNTDNCTQKT